VLSVGGGEDGRRERETETESLIQAIGPQNKLGSNGLEYKLGWRLYQGNATNRKFDKD